MSNFFTIREIALANAIDKNYPFYYRKICRWYSQTFSTPLTEVENLQADYVLLHYFEDLFDQMTEEGKYDTMQRVLDPDFDSTEEAELNDFIQQVESEVEGKKLKQQSNNQGKPTAKVRNFQEPPPPTVADGLDGLDDITKV